MFILGYGQAKSGCLDACSLRRRTALKKRGSCVSISETTVSLMVLVVHRFSDDIALKSRSQGRDCRFF